MPTDAGTAVAAQDEELRDIAASFGSMIQTIFDNLEEQFELSQAVAESGVFSGRAPSLPPPRVSQVVVHGYSTLHVQLVAGGNR
jgi:hypothetical protein